MIVIGSNYTNVTNVKRNVSATIYYLKDVNNVITLIESKDLQSYGIYDRITLNPSPQLTKVAYFYNYMSSYSYNVAIKSIDYVNNKIIDVSFPDITHYL